MNTTNQLEFHPDAESLNAFTEKALPEREREQVVAHLAGCGRCRQVIFLARQAAEEMEEAAVPAARSARRSGSWLSGWRVAWIPAAALATVVGLVFLVHGRHEETGTEVARVVPQIARQEAENATKPAATAREIARKSSAPVLPEEAKPAESKVESAPAVVAYQPIPAEVVPPAAAVSEPVTVTAAQPLNGRNYSAMQTLTAGQEYSAAPPIPQPATARMPQHVTGGYSNNATANYAPEAKMDEMEERSQASRKAEARYAGSGGASTSQIKKDVLPNSSFDAGAQMPALRFEAAPEAKTAALPSGLAAVSTVTAENRTLAIDQAGALFFSKDSGSHWESVPQQWTGRAVDVILLQPLNGRTFTVAPASGAAVPPSPQPEIFELRNDKNQTWVSVDGTTWKAQ